MKNNKGMLTRPSNRPVKEHRPIFATCILAILLVVSYVFTIKVYEPVTNVNVTGGIIFYPLTFLVVAYIAKYYGFKEARKSIFISIGAFFVFILLMMVGVMLPANNQTTSYNAVIQYLYTNDFFMIGDFRVFYPILGQFFGLSIAFVVSHLLFATVYNAIHGYTADYLAMGLSAFIASIIDRVVFMPLLFLQNLLDEVVTFDYFIKCLTSEFIMTIVAILVIIVLYVIITSVKDSRDKKKGISF